MELCKEICKIAIETGEEIMKYYNEENIILDTKEDKSNLTKVDLVAHNFLVKELEQISDYPIFSEEDIIDYDVRKNWKQFWLIDPLDGTKDYSAKNGHFTINIALIENNIPILGVVYLPFYKDIYYAVKDKGAFKNGLKIYNNSKRTSLIGADSNFYSSEEMKYFFEKYNIKDIKKIGSSIKICKLAEGEIDVYPRLNGSKEWDTAAVHIIANESGCKLIDIETKKELEYNKQSYKNNFFIASRNNLEFEV